MRRMFLFECWLLRTIRRRRMASFRAAVLGGFDAMYGSGIERVMD